MNATLRDGVCALLAVVLLLTPGCLSSAESAQEYRDQLGVGSRRATLFELLGAPDVSEPDASGVMWTYEFGGDGGRRLAMIPEAIGMIVLGIILTGVVIGLLVLVVAYAAAGGRGGGHLPSPSMPNGTPRYKAIWRVATPGTSAGVARLRLHLSEGLIDWLSPVEVR
jgi:hypothetical protein